MALEEHYTGNRTTKGAQRRAVFYSFFFSRKIKKKREGKKKKKQGERDMSLASEFAWSVIQEEGRQRRTHMFIPSDSNKEPIVGSTCLRKSALCS